MDNPYETLQMPSIQTKPIILGSISNVDFNQFPTPSHVIFDLALMHVSEFRLFDIIWSRFQLIHYW